MPRVLVMLAVSSLAGCGDTRQGSAPAAETAQDPGYSASEAEIVQTGADGLPKYRLQARHIEQDPRSLEVALEEIRLETREGSAGSWQVSAPRGRLSKDAERLQLDGGVLLQGGQRPGAEPLRLRTASLAYDLNTSRVRAPGEVELALQGHVLAGTGLDANLRTRQVRLQADVHGRFTR
ncbi:MAG: LPS export ABC transporter periplasmic protein LptC [Gammaproteobacteria bacterium]|nr:LPS export ABC transporter periplasmic protein LptC [Gammaproteobacteria bacterium]